MSVKELKNQSKPGNLKGTAGVNPVVTEDRRIYFKQQLVQFRENEEIEISFPSNLSSTERKFLHRTATELGLISGSSGVGEDRFITVKKGESNQNASVSREPIAWSFAPNTFQILRSIHFPKSEVVSDEGAVTGTTATNQRNPQYAARRSVIEKLIGSHKFAELKRRQHADYEKIQEKRATLPAAQHRLEFCSLIKENNVILISGETGCGKSTQVPQFLLEDESIGASSKIVITQPRRISAVTLAERIAYERSEDVGDIVGYNIRMESKQRANTQILFVTAGVLLRKLIDDPLLEEYTHIIVDEAHERDRFTEFLLIILRDISERRKSLRLILMSATMHTNKLRAYFGDIPQLSVGGSIFPVQEFYLEHVLKFINYAPKDKSATAGNGVIEREKSWSTVYSCALCNKGPFLSPEELGTHAAQCYPHQNRSNQDGYNRFAKQAKLQALAERMQYLEYKIRFNSSSLAASAATAKNTENKEDSSILVYETEEDIAEEEKSIDDDTSVDYIDLPDRQEIGMDKQFSNDDDPLLNNLLKLYQESQSTSDDAQLVDLDLIIALMQYIVHSEFFSQRGHILLFLPGWDDITRLQRLLSTHSEFSNQSKYRILPLHSSLPKKEQTLVFQELANKNEIKIILSTNIAETSVTIDDISIVIDTGLAKEKIYDPHTKLSFLKTSFISKAAAKQRKGRAGRTRAGVCFHLFSLLRAKHLQEFQESELLRIPLEELALQAKSLSLAEGRGDDADSVKSFLLKALDPPHELAIANAIDLLKSLHCFTEDERLTELGKTISQFPFNPRLGKMILFGCLVGGANVSAMIASILSYRDPFLLPTNESQRLHTQQIKMQYLQTSNNSGDNSIYHSDQIVVIQLLQLFQSYLHRFHYQEAKTFCEKHDLLYSVMLYLVDMTKQITTQMNELLQLPLNHHRLIRNNTNLNIISLILASGLYPYITTRYDSQLHFTTEKGFKVKIHPLSINSKLSYYKKERIVGNKKRNGIDIFGYQELFGLNIHQSTYYKNSPNYLMLNLTSMNVFLLLLIAARVKGLNLGSTDQEGKSTSNDHETMILVEVDDWILLSMPFSHYLLIEQCRRFLSGSLINFVKDPQVIFQSELSKNVDLLILAMEEEQREMTRLYK